MGLDARIHKTCPNAARAAALVESIMMDDSLGMRTV
jgi:hypothetical protein